MNEDQLERISALADGALEDPEAARVAAETGRDDEARRRWACYHLIGEVLRENHHLVPHRVVADGVRDALASEPAVLAPRPAVGAGLLRPVAGLALAASVAAVAVLGVRGWHASVPGPVRTAAAPVVTPGVAPERTGGPARLASAGSDQAPAAARPPARVVTGLPPGVSASLAGLQWNDPRPAVTDRLNVYLLNHSEYVGHGIRGMLPYARIVGYDARN